MQFSLQFAKIFSHQNFPLYGIRLVAQSCCNQKFGLDCKETFSSVVQFESVKCLLVLEAQYKPHLHQMNVATAFLHGEPSEDDFKKPSWHFQRTSFNSWAALSFNASGLMDSKLVCDRVVTNASGNCSVRKQN